MERKRYSRSSLFAIRDARTFTKPDFASNPRLARLNLWRLDSSTSSIGGTTPTTPTPYAVDHLMPAFAKRKVDPASVSQSKDDKPVRRIGSGRLVPRENWAPQSSSNNKKLSNSRNGSAFDEPEWFSGGPTSQLDTIELRGFEEEKEPSQPPPPTQLQQKHQPSPPQKQQPQVPSLPPPSLEKEKEKPFDFGDFMEEVEVSVSKILGNDRKEENSRGKIWFGGNDNFSTSRVQPLPPQQQPQQQQMQQISQPIPPSQPLPQSTAPIPSQPPNLAFINFLRKEPEITSVEELEAKMRLAEVSDRQQQQQQQQKKPPQPDSDAFRKLLEQLGPGNQQQQPQHHPPQLQQQQQPPHMMHQPPHQMHFPGGPGGPGQIPGDFFLNRQDILKTPEAQVLVQSFLKGELTQQDLFHIQKLNPNKHEIVGAVIQYTTTMFPPFFHPMHRPHQQQQPIHFGAPIPAPVPVPPNSSSNNNNNRRQKLESGSGSPTPNLAFTPTSVLRKMTGDIKPEIDNMPPPPARMILGCHSQRPMGRPILKQGVHEDFHQMNRRFPSTTAEQEQQIGKMKLLNYQRDGGLSPTSNQLARWFSPELLAQASAGKLPSLNIGQALNLQDFERSMQSSTNSTICNN